MTWRLSVSEDICDKEYLIKDDFKNNLKDITPKKIDILGLRIYII